jgi:hypothetical protein
LAWKRKEGEKQRCVSRYWLFCCLFVEAGALGSKAAYDDKDAVALADWSGLFGQIIPLPHHFGKTEHPRGKLGEERGKWREGEERGERGRGGK